MDRTYINSRTVARATHLELQDHLSPQGHIRYMFLMRACIAFKLSWQVGTMASSCSVSMVTLLFLVLAWTGGQAMPGIGSRDARSTLRQQHQDSGSHDLNVTENRFVVFVCNFFNLSELMCELRPAAIRTVVRCFARSERRVVRINRANSK